MAPTADLEVRRLQQQPSMPVIRPMRLAESAVAAVLVAHLVAMVATAAMAGLQQQSQRAPEHRKMLAILQTPPEEPEVLGDLAIKVVTAAMVVKPSQLQQLQPRLGAPLQQR